MQSIGYFTYMTGLELWSNTPGSILFKLAVSVLSHYTGFAHTTPHQMLCCNQKSGIAPPQIMPALQHVALLKVLQKAIQTPTSVLSGV